METQIESLRTPADAQVVLKQIAKAEDAFRIQQMAEDRGEEWRTVALRAERLYGQLIGKAKRGGIGSNQYNTESYVSNRNIALPERLARCKARKTAAVPENIFEDYLTDNLRPSHNGLLKYNVLRTGKQPSPSSRSKDEKWSKPEVFEPIRDAVQAGQPVDQIAHDLGISSSTAGRTVIYVRGLLDGQNTTAPVITPVVTGGRPKNFNSKSNDKRLRELRASRSKDNYADLLKFQRRVAEMCVILEDYHLVEEGLLTDVSLDRLSDVHDDLLTLGEWWERAVSAVQSRLSEHTVLQKIAKLREITGRTPEEAETALRLADRLERKLGSRLST